MYPLVIVLGIGALRDDRAVRWYALPLAGIGAALAFYHALVQRVPSLQQATSCSAEAPCNAMWGARVRFDFYTRNGAGRFLAHCRIAAGCLVGCYSRESGRQIGN